MWRRWRRPKPPDVDRVRGLILDIDGVLLSGGQACPGAADTLAILRRQGIVLRFLTNSTLKSRRSCAEGLRAAGLEAAEAEVFTASYAASVYLRQLRPRSVWLMLEGNGLEEFRWIVSDWDSPEYLVIGDNRSEFDFNTLSRALRVLAKGAGLIGMQAELVDLSMGQLELNVGSFVGMLERASGVQAVYLGKPNPYAFSLTLASMGLREDEVAVVGDQVATDIQGAQEAGLRAILVKTGRFARRDLDLGIKPDVIIDSIASLPGLLEGKESAFSRSSRTSTRA